MTGFNRFRRLLFQWIADCRPGTRIDRLAILLGMTMVRSNGLMLERAQACCRLEGRHIRRCE